MEAGRGSQVPRLRRRHSPRSALALARHDRTAPRGSLGLRWADVDLSRQSLVVRPTVVSVGYEIHVSRPKSGKGRRVVALDSGSVDVLRAHRTRRSRADSDDFVFGDGCQPLHQVKVSKAFGRAVRESGLPRIRLHDLRHTHATLALEAGIHPKIVSERLRHSTVALTLDIYSHALQHMQSKPPRR